MNIIIMTRNVRKIIINRYKQLGPVWYFNTKKLTWEKIYVTDFQPIFQKNYEQIFLQQVIIINYPNPSEKHNIEGDLRSQSEIWNIYIYHNIDT